MREERRGAITAIQLSAECRSETDAAFRKCSARLKRQIFAALEKIACSRRNPQQPLRQKHLDPAIRPRLHQFSRSRARQRFQHFAAQL